MICLTHREEHQGGYRVIEINAAQGFVDFENGLRLSLRETIGPSPIGNLVLFYPYAAAGEPVLEDLKRLLRVSRMIRAWWLRTLCVSAPPDGRPKAIPVRGRRRRLSEQSVSHADRREHMDPYRRRPCACGCREVAS